MGEDRRVRYPAQAPLDEWTGLPDHRHTDLGLSDEEASYVLRMCKKFVNHRDHLEDCYQTCLLALFEGFQRVKQRGDVVRHRNAYIHQVCVNILKYRFVQEPKWDLLYHSFNNSHTVYSAYDGDEAVDRPDLIEVYEGGQCMEAPSVLEAAGTAADDVDRLIVLQVLMDRILTPEEIDMFLQYEQSGYVQREIAEAFHTTQTRVSITLAKIRLKLAEALSDMLTEEELFN